LFEEAVRWYTKLIGDKAYYQAEQSLATNEPVNIVLKKFRTKIKLDENILSLSI
jgi:hypothetical protein